MTCVAVGTWDKATGVCAQHPDQCHWVVNEACEVGVSQPKEGKWMTCNAPKDQTEYDLVDENATRQAPNMDDEAVCAWAPAPKVAPVSATLKQGKGPVAFAPKKKA